MVFLYLFRLVFNLLWYAARFCTGPVSFPNHINDLRNVSSKFTSYLFADNTNIFFESKDLSYLIKTVKKQLRSVKI